MPAKKRITALTELEKTEIMDTLDSDTRALVDAGLVKLWRGRNGKPVLRDAKGKILPGSGLHLNENHGNTDNATAMSWKRTNAYRSLIEKYFTEDKFDAMLEAGFEASIGHPISKEAVCHDCGATQQIEMYRKPDSTIFFKVLEQLMGRAEETKQINVDSEHLHRLIDERTDVTEVETFSVRPEVSEARRERIESEDAEYVIVDDN